MCNPKGVNEMDWKIRESAQNKKNGDRTLAEKLSMWRAERPDEWKMDEFIREAKELEEENKRLKSESKCDGEVKEYQSWFSRPCSNYDKCPIDKDLHCYENKPCFN